MRGRRFCRRRPKAPVAGSEQPGTRCASLDRGCQVGSGSCGSVAVWPGVGREPSPHADVSNTSRLLQAISVTMSNTSGSLHITSWTVDNLSGIKLLRDVEVAKRGVVIESSHETILNIFFWKRLRVRLRSGHMYLCIYVLSDSAFLYSTDITPKSTGVGALRSPPIIDQR